VSTFRSLLCFSTFFRWLLSWVEGIGDALDIQDERAASKNPLLWGVDGLQLGSEHIRLVSVSRHVYWALIDTLLLFTLDDHLSCAMDQWHD